MVKAGKMSCAEGEFMFFKKKELELVSPVKGKLISIKDVPDVTFSEEMVGYLRRTRFAPLQMEP